ncbi:hypothetical protein B0T10DRAFT_564665 [Thelonectria olida]|uniref:SWIRM domain-containing protein n=1 Tax=Thelonectria olida TaxID=1576542 RepID=A0A9P9AII9_9HYPO|nr:hypothetical protein B0T10DRAFT_564665 [Thelonectria olida]
MTNTSPRNTNATASMAPPAVPAASMGMAVSKKLDINSLMSPPDPPLDSFNHHSEMGQSGIAAGRQASTEKHPLPMSPPISPYSKPMCPTERISPAPAQIQDPVLYEENAPSSPSQQEPLFAPAEVEEETRRIVDGHVAARSVGSFAGVTLPKREEYELVLSFRSQVMKHYTANPRAWLRQERAYLLAEQRARAQHTGGSRYPTILPASRPAVRAPRTQRADRVTKPAAPRPIRTSPGSSSHPGPMRPAQARPRISATPEPSRRVVAPNREDKDFRSIPDYCPPLDSLPNRPNSLKVDWKGQPIDLSNDPHIQLLHPDEVTLAGNLRLDCATYLTSKRRIFERRLACLRTGKEFRKTDAQQACKIDVNKASKLWTAFDKVGWLDAEWVRKFYVN